MTAESSTMRTRIRRSVLGMEQGHLTRPPARALEQTQVRALLGASLPRHLLAEPLDVDLARVGAEVDAPGQVAAKVPAHHRNAFGHHELLDEADVAVGDAVAVQRQAQDVPPAEDLSLQQVSLSARLLHGGDQQTHGVYAQPSRIGG